MGRTGTRKPPRQKKRRSTLTPVWLITAVFSGLMVYVVVTKADQIKEVHVAGTGIVFRGKSAANTLTPDEQRERSRQVEAAIEEKVREAAPATTPPPVDLSGTWTTPEGTASWAVSLENGLFVFREANAAAPGIVTAAGYGPFDGRTWSPQFQTMLGVPGTASLTLSDDGALEGDIVVGGERFSLVLRR
jgi:hypothetical protein